MSMTKQEELIDKLYKLSINETHTLSDLCLLHEGDRSTQISNLINELYILTFCTRKEVKE